MKRIRLTQGKSALVDDADFELLSKYNWCYSRGYAIRYIGGGRKNPKFVWMHRVINGTPERLITDHINGDKLDNRKANLRTVDKSLNMINSKVRQDNKSGYRGVSWDKSRNKWAVQFTIHKKSYRLGRYSTLEKAVKVYEETANKLAKEYLWHKESISN